MNAQECIQIVQKRNRESARDRSAEQLLQQKETSSGKSQKDM